MKLRNPRDFWAGVFFIVIGGGALWIASGYDFGSARKMGAGYFPSVVAALLAFLGVIISSKSFMTDGERIEEFAWRPLLVILGSVVVYGIIVKILGIALSLVLLVIGVAAGSHESRWREVLISAVVLSIFSVGVFIYGLGLPFAVWPAFVG